MSGLQKFLALRDQQNLARHKSTVSAKELSKTQQPQGHLPPTGPTEGSGNALSRPVSQGVCKAELQPYENGRHEDGFSTDLEDFTEASVVDDQNERQSSVYDAGHEAAGRKSRAKARIEFRGHRGSESDDDLTADSSDEIDDNLKSEQDPTVTLASILEVERQHDPRNEHNDQSKDEQKLSYLPQCSKGGSKTSRAHYRGDSKEDPQPASDDRYDYPKHETRQTNEIQSRGHFSPFSTKRNSQRLRLNHADRKEPQTTATSSSQSWSGTHKSPEYVSSESGLTSPAAEQCRLLEDKLQMPIEELKIMSFADLKKRQVELDMCSQLTKESSQKEDVSLPSKLHHTLSMGPKEQRDLCNSLSLEQWEEAGDWFLEQFSSTLLNVKEARRARRQTTARFEEEVEQRESQVRVTDQNLGEALQNMKRTGQDVLKGRGGS